MLEIGRSRDTNHENNDVSNLKDNDQIIYRHKVEQNDAIAMINLADLLLHQMVDESHILSETRYLDKYFKRLCEIYTDELKEDVDSYQEKIDDLQESDSCADISILQALYLYLLAAEQGEGLAEARLGYCYSFGLGVQRSLNQSLKYYKLALEHGIATALDCARLLIQLKLYQEANKYFCIVIECPQSYSINEQAEALASLGMSYENGYGVDKSEFLAFKYYQESFNLMPLVGIDYLASAYSKGLGIEKNSERATWLYLETIKKISNSIEETNDETCHFIGNCYLAGKGVIRNIQRAVEYFKKGAKSKGSLCLRDLAWFYIDRGPSIEAFQYAEKMALLGDSYYLYYLGFLYEKGWVVKKSTKHAIAYYKKAAEIYDPIKRKDIEACLALAELYEKNTDTLDLAFFYYKKAAKSGNSKAHYKTGYFYENGYGVKSSNAKAVYHYKIAAEMGYPSGVYAYALCLKEGKGCRKSSTDAMKYLSYLLKMNTDLELKARTYEQLGNIYEKDTHKEASLKLAFKCYSKAADYDKCFSYSIARAYELGIGIKRDLKKAAEYYRTAHTLGNVKATYRLALFYYKGPISYRSIILACKYLLDATQMGCLKAFYILAILQKSEQDRLVWKCFGMDQVLKQRLAQVQ